MSQDSFPPAVIEALGYYVYLLRDPDTDEVFYVGKGIGNRIFAHIQDSLSDKTDNLKLDRIRSIYNQGKQVKHTIHRHGLTEKEAFEVEAALIDIVGLADLTNKVSGHHSHDRGPMTIPDVIASYDAREIEIKEPSIIIVINQLYQRGMSQDELFRVTSGNWVIGKRREKAQYAFAVANSLVRQVYRIENWYLVTDSHAKTRERWRFEGHIAEEEKLQSYVNGSIRRYITQGAQNPIKYVNC